MPLLKDLFLEKIEPKNYYQTENGKWIVYHNGEYYFSCDTEEQAKKSVEKLKKVNWDKTLIPSIKKEYKIVPKNSKNKTGFYRTHICKDKKMEKGFKYMYEFETNGLRIRLSNKKLSGLREKVKNNNLLWMPLNEDAKKIENMFKERGMGEL